MGFVVTEEMAREFGKALAAAYKRAGTNLQEDRLKVMQEFIDRHNLAPASAVEEVELTHSEWLRLWTTVGRADEGKLAQAGKSYLASLGLRIVRDAKPAASFIRRAQPLNLPDDDGFCSVGGLAVDLGLYKSSDAKPVPADDAAKRDAKDATIAELMKRVDALELGYRDAKATNAEIQDDVDRLDAATGELLEWCKRLSREKAPAESRNPEPKTVAAAADDSLGLTDEEIDAGVRDSCYTKVGFPPMADGESVDAWAKRMTEMQRDAFRAAVVKHRKERGGC